MYIAGIQTEEQQYNEQFVIMFTLVMTQLKQVRNMIDFSVVRYTNYLQYMYSV